jgi:hypothetical protein
LRFTAPRTRRAFVYPARHFASDLTDPDLPAMGQRLRLKRAFDISRFPRQSRIVHLHTLHDVPGSAFEVVDSASLPRP